MTSLSMVMHNLYYVEARHKQNTHTVTTPIIQDANIDEDTSHTSQDFHAIKGGLDQENLHRVHETMSHFMDSALSYLKRWIPVTAEP